MSPISQQAMNVLVALVIGQAFLGLIAAIGFYAVVRRHIDKEIPALFAEVNGRLETLHKDFERLSEKLERLALDAASRLASHEARLSALERGPRA